MAATGHAAGLVAAASLSFNTSFIYLLIRRGGPAGLLLGYLVLGAALGCFVLPSFLSELFPPGCDPAAWR